MSTIIYPSHYRIFECRAGRWFIKNAEAFCIFRNGFINHNDLKALYGVTEQTVIINLFRINSGKSGYYLANLKDKKYYYCGLKEENIKTTLRGLGIGRADPLEK